MEGQLLKQVLALSGSSSVVITVALCYFIFQYILSKLRLEISEKYETKANIENRLDKIDKKLDEIQSCVDRLKGKFNSR